MPNAVNTQCSQIDYLQNQLQLARKEIYNLRQQIKSLNHLHRREIDEISSKLNGWQCGECRRLHSSRTDATAIAAEPPTDASSSSSNNSVAIRYIGMIHTNFPEKRATPRQPALCPQATAKLVLNTQIFTNPSHALDGLRDFSHMWLLFHFHRGGAPTHHSVHAKVSPPRLNGARTGVFATRSPHRPNPIGLSLVRIDRIDGDAVYFSGVDMVDGTPAVDIKPYIPQYDSPQQVALVAASPHVAVEAAASSPSRLMDGEENRREHVIGAAATSLARTTLEEYTSSRMGEREAPDGEEEEVSPNGGGVGGVNTALNSHGGGGGGGAQSIVPVAQNDNEQSHIRVPSWVDHSPVSTLCVTFKEKALTQLQQLGEEGAKKKAIIENILKEDPRSVYLRERWGSHCYVFRIAELCVSCKFNDDTHTVTVFQIFQNDTTEHDE